MKVLCRHVYGHTYSTIILIQYLIKLPSPFLYPFRKQQEDNNVYQKALNQIKCVIKPLVAGVDLDEEDVIMKDITRDELKLKQEPIENGTVD